MYAVHDMSEADEVLSLGSEAREKHEGRGEPLPFERDPLWIRIKDFPFDDAASRLPFSQRLARENGWSRYYACRVIEEYKRFCYLAMTAGHSVTPSDEVDQAWHLHLLYTESYWDDFCGRVLKRKLYHGPTRGGPDESAKYHAWYEETLVSYRRTFGSPPPADIWPAVDARFADRQAFGRVNTAAYWLVPKPRFRFLRLLPVSKGGVSAKSARIPLGMIDDRGPPFDQPEPRVRALIIRIRAWHPVRGLTGRLVSVFERRNPEGLLALTTENLRKLVAGSTRARQGSAGGDRTFPADSKVRSRQILADDGLPAPLAQLE